MKSKFLSLLIAVSPLVAAQEAEKYDYPFQPPKRGQTVIVQQAPAPVPAPTPVIIVNDNHIPVPYPVYLGKRAAEADEPKAVVPTPAPAVPCQVPPQGFPGPRAGWRWSPSCAAS